LNPDAVTKKGQLKSWPFLFYWATVSFQQRFQATTLRSWCSPKRLHLNPDAVTKKGQLKSWPFLFYWATVFSAKVSGHDAAVVVQPRAAAFES
jgi:hypothetical protein